MKNTFKYFRKNYKLNAYITREGGYWMINIENFSDEDNDTPYNIDCEYETHFDYYKEAKKACIKEMKSYCKL